MIDSSSIHFLMEPPMNRPKTSSESGESHQADRPTRDVEREYVEAYRTSGDVEAELIERALAEESIPVRIEGGSLEDLFGVRPPAWEFSPRIMVGEDDAARAKASIERLLATRVGDDAADRWRCLKCGAELSIDEDRCERCDWSFQDPVVG
jgi:hypothetical protein